MQDTKKTKKRGEEEEIKQRNKKTLAAFVLCALLACMCVCVCECGGVLHQRIKKNKEQSYNASFFFVLLRLNPHNLCVHMWEVTHNAADASKV
jgi:hypothetical protein